jgi:enamine deaminase RidA (YjgF/YER057c/UK114 family)
MPKQQITSAKIRQPSGHFSHATMVAARGRIVFISGMTARRPDGTIAGIGDVEAQTRQVCQNLKAAVEEAGGNMDDICRVAGLSHRDQRHRSCGGVMRAAMRRGAPMPGGALNVAETSANR